MGNSIFKFMPSCINICVSWRNVISLILLLYYYFLFSFLLRNEVLQRISKMFLTLDVT